MEPGNNHNHLTAQAHTKTHLIHHLLIFSRRVVVAHGVLSNRATEKVETVYGRTAPVPTVFDEFTQLLGDAWGC